MFKLNGFDVELKENLSIGELLEEVKENKDLLPIYGHGQIIIVNGDILSSINKNNYIINEGDDIRIMPLMGGG